MELEIFKEKVCGSYNNNGGCQIVIEDIKEITNLMLNKLVFLKVTPDEITEVFELNTLYVVKNVYEDCDGIITLDLTNIRDSTVRTSHIDDVTLMTNRILEYPWFINSVKKQFSLDGIKELSKQNLLSIINTHNMDVKIHDQSEGIVLMISIDYEFIKSLITKETDIKYFYDYITISDVSSGENYKVVKNRQYKVTRLLGDEYKLEDFLSLSYEHTHQYKAIQSTGCGFQFLL